MFFKLLQKTAYCCKDQYFLRYVTFCYSSVETVSPGSNLLDHCFGFLYRRLIRNHDIYRFADRISGCFCSCAIHTVRANIPASSIGKLSFTRPVSVSYGISDSKLPCNPCIRPEKSCNIAGVCIFWITPVITAIWSFPLCMDLTLCKCMSFPCKCQRFNTIYLIASFFIMEGRCNIKRIIGLNSNST